MNREMCFARRRTWEPLDPFGQLLPVPFERTKSVRLASIK